MRSSWRWLACASLFTLALGCKTREPAITGLWIDDFEREDLGPGWNDTSGGGYVIAAGKLTTSRAYNHPLWLRRKLPKDAVIDVDVMSKSRDGDLKIQLWGNGDAFDTDKGVNDAVTGYTFIFGGWKNTESWLCRLGEHDDQRKAGRSDVRVEPGRSYHWTITRKGGAIDWKVDGKPFLAWTDPAPLEGEGHEYLAFDDWEAEVVFDNLRIRPAR